MPEQHERDEMVTVLGGTGEGGTAAAFADLRERGFSLVESMYIVARASGISVDASAEAISASGVWQDWAHYVERGKGIVTSSERAGAARALLRTAEHSSRRAIVAAEQNADRLDVPRQAEVAAKARPAPRRLGFSRARRRPE